MAEFVRLQRHGAIALIIVGVIGVGASGHIRPPHRFHHPKPGGMMTTRLNVSSS